MVMEAVRCDLCGEKQYQVVLTLKDQWFEGTPTDEFQMVRCQGCQLLYVNPRPKESDMGKFYPDQYFPFNLSPKKPIGKIKQWVMEEFYGYPATESRTLPRSIRKLVSFPDWLLRKIKGREILPYVGDGRLLDVGCGAGANLEGYRNEGWDIYGIEINPAAAEAARNRVGDRIHTGSLEHCPYQEEMFDVIVFNHSLEHMFRPITTLQQARRILKPHGMIVIAVPNASSLEARLFGPWWCAWDLPRHLYHFNSRSLSQMLTNAGFSPIRIRTGKDAGSFMASLEGYVEKSWKRKVRAKKLIERVLVKPFTLIMGHIGVGSEISIFAMKR